MTLKELKDKLDKLGKVYGDKIEIMVFTKGHGQSRVYLDTYLTPNAIEVRTEIDDKGNSVENIYILRK